MKTRLLWTLTVIVLCAVVVAALATGCARKPPAAPTDKEPYRIGAMFAVTGPASPLGEPERLDPAGDRTAADHHDPVAQRVTLGDRRADRGEPRVAQRARIVGDDARAELDHGQGHPAEG